MPTRTREGKKKKKLEEEIGFPQLANIPDSFLFSFGTERNTSKKIHQGKIHRLLLSPNK